MPSENNDLSITNSNNRSIFSGKIDINIVLSFIFGVIFLSIMLVFSTQYPNPTPFQLKSFITVLSLAAAGVGAVIPGFMEIRYKGFLRASGALALFVLVFFFQPTLEKAVVKLDVPPSSPDPVADSFLHAIDVGQIKLAWDELDPVAKGLVVPDEKALEQLYINYRQPLGKALSRIITGTGGVDSPNGYPVGAYRWLVYKTKFEHSTGCRNEQVTVRATQNIEWKVFSYQIGPSAIEC